MEKIAKMRIYEIVSYFRCPGDEYRGELGGEGGGQVGDRARLLGRVPASSTGRFSCTLYSNW